MKPGDVCTPAGEHWAMTVPSLGMFRLLTAKEHQLVTNEGVSMASAQVPGDRMCGRGVGEV